VAHNGENTNEKEYQQEPK